MPLFAVPCTRFSTQHRSTPSRVPCSQRSSSTVNHHNKALYQSNDLCPHTPLPNCSAVKPNRPTLGNSTRSYTIHALHSPCSNPLGIIMIACRAIVLTKRTDSRTCPNCNGFEVRTPRPCPSKNFLIAMSTDLLFASKKQSETWVRLLKVGEHKKGCWAIDCWRPFQTT